MTTVLRRSSQTLLAVLLAAVTALLLAVVVVPLVLGWVPLTVLSGSMEPTVPTGSQVVVEPLEGEADAARLGVGDVVTFMPRPDDDALVTHRIVGVAVGGDGVRTFTTQGDANAVPDPEPVTATQLRGLVRYHVPAAGHAATLLDAGQKRTGVVLVAAALFGYALWQLVGAARGRNGRPRPAAADQPRPQGRDDAPVRALPAVPAGAHHG